LIWLSKLNIAAYEIFTSNAIKREFYDLMVHILHPTVSQLYGAKRIPSDLSSLSITTLYHYVGCWGSEVVVTAVK